MHFSPYCPLGTKLKLCAPNLKWVFFFFFFFLSALLGFGLLGGFFGWLVGFFFLVSVHIGIR